MLARVQAQARVLGPAPVLEQAQVRVLELVPVRVLGPVPPAQDLL